MKIGQIKEQPEGTSILSVFGKVTKVVFPYEEKDGKYGKQTSQLVKLKDDTGVIDVRIGDQPPVNEGEYIGFVGKQSEKFGLSGLKVTMYKDFKQLKVTKSAMIKLGNDFKEAMVKYADDTTATAGAGTKTQARAYVKPQPVSVANYKAHLTALFEFTRGLLDDNKFEGPETTVLNTVLIQTKDLGVNFNDEPAEQKEDAAGDDFDAEDIPK